MHVIFFFFIHITSKLFGKTVLRSFSKAFVQAKIIHTCVAASFLPPGLHGCGVGFRLRLRGAAAEGGQVGAV